MKRRPIMYYRPQAPQGSTFIKVCRIQVARIQQDWHLGVCSWGALWTQGLCICRAAVGCTTPACCYRSITGPPGHTCPSHSPLHCMQPRLIQAASGNTVVICSLFYLEHGNLKLCQPACNAPWSYALLLQLVQQGRMLGFCSSMLALCSLQLQSTTSLCFRVFCLQSSSLAPCILS